MGATLDLTKIDQSEIHTLDLTTIDPNDVQDASAPASGALDLTAVDPKDVKTLDLTAINPADVSAQPDGETKLGQAYRRYGITGAVANIAGGITDWSPSAIIGAAGPDQTAEEAHKAGDNKEYFNQSIQEDLSHLNPFSKLSRDTNAQLWQNYSQYTDELAQAQGDPAKIAAINQKWGSVADLKNPGAQVALNMAMGFGAGPEIKPALTKRPTLSLTERPTETAGPGPAAEAGAAAPAPDVTPPTPQPAPSTGMVFGLRNPDGSIQRGVIDNIQDGAVIWKTEDGTTHANTVDDLTKDMVPPPEPSGAMDNATTVETPPARVTEPAPPTDADLNDFNPWDEGPAPAPREPAPPSPQQAMALPDTTKADTALAAARNLRKNAAEAERIAATGTSTAKSPDEIALMHRQAETLEAEALATQRDVGAKQSGPAENLPPVDTDKGRLGELGQRAPAETEATTGVSLTEPGSPAKRAEIEEANRKAPLLQQENAAGAELPPPDTSRARMGELGINAPAESEATTGRQMSTPGKPGRAPAPLDIVQAVADAGGLKDETALKFDNSAAGRAKKRGGELDFLYSYPAKGARKARSVVVPGTGLRSVINNRRGLGADYMRAHLIERGYLPEGATVDDMYSALRSNISGEKQFSVHGPNSDINDVVALHERQAADRAADMEQAGYGPDQEVRDQLVSPDTWFGDHPTMEDMDALDALISPEMMGALRPDEHESVMRRIDEAAGPDVVNVAKEGTHEGDFYERPVEERNPSAERVPESGQEQEADAGTAREGDEGSGAPAEAERSASQPTVERTPEGEQLVIPGGERSTRQAAEARPERMRSGVKQRVPDEGLFGEDTRRQGDIEDAADSPYRRSGFADVDSAIREISGRNENPTSVGPAGAVGDEAGPSANGDGPKLEQQTADDSGYSKGTKLAAGFDPFDVYNTVRDVVHKIGDAIKLSSKKEGSAPEVAGDVLKSLPSGRKVKGAITQALASANRILSFASTVASRDPVSARYYASDLMRERYRESLERSGGETLAKYEALPEAGRQRIAKILEHDRLTGYDRQDTGRRAVARMPENYPGELAKPGEIVTLSPQETAALNDLRGFFDTRLGEIGEAMAHRFGYQDEFNPQAIQSAIDNAQHPRERTVATRAMDVYNMINEARRKGYVPLQRYGNHYIRVSTKPGYEPGKDGLQPSQTVRFELIDTEAPQSDAFITGGKKISQETVAERRAALEKQFPKDKFDIDDGAVTPPTIRSLDIPAMEKLFMLLSQKAPELSDRLYDEVMTQVYQDAKAGFRKQSNNVPGYSTDFERAISDYVRQSSRVVSDMEMGRRVDEAYDATQQHPDLDVRDFWKSYKQHLENGKTDFAALRKVAFFQNLWGSAKAVVANLTQTPLVTQMQLGSWAGPRAPIASHQALLEALGAVRPSVRGLEMNWDHLGRTPEEKAMIRQLRKEGVLDPVISKDLQGADAAKSQSLRPIAKKVQTAYNFGASGFNVAEQANRVAAALSAFRMAKMPELLAKAQKVYAKDELWQEMVGRDPTPTNVARFMVDETQFIGGKRGRPQVMRGIGAPILQFKQYPANYFRLMNKNFNRMGPEGKIAGTLMLTALGAGAGVEGEPFVQDLIKLYEWANKTATGIDPMLNFRMAKALREWGLSPNQAEMVLHGASRGTPVDLSNSIGMGNIAPDDDSVLSTVPFLSSTVGKAEEIYGRLKAGQPLAAAGSAAQVLSGKGPSDAIRAITQLPSEGYQTQYGDLVIPPSQITQGQQLAKGLGFQPTEFSRQQEFRTTEKRLKSATQQASTQLLTNIARNFALADDARKQGRYELAKSYDADNDAILEKNRQQLTDAGIPDWQKVPAPQRQSVKQRIRAMIDFQGAQIKQAGKMKRGAMSDYPLPH